ncbi:MAG: amidohydrolase, partial [Woeseiaceae bacterium]
MQTGLLLLAALWLLVGCQDGRQAAAMPSPDSVFVGNFITLDIEQPDSTAIAVTDGRIVAMGTTEEVLALAGEQTRRIDIPGVAMPGWVDAHVHISGLGSVLDQLNVEAMSIDEIRDTVAEAVRATPPGEWIVGRGWDEGYFREPRDPTAADLDIASPGHPVVLAGIGGHSVWVNSAALERAGITAQTRDPEGGRIVRDGDGRPTGLLLEQAEALVRAVMPDTHTPATRERHIRTALAQYARWGLTGVHDAGASLDEIAIYKKLLESGQLPLRIYAMAAGDEAVTHYLARAPEPDLGDGRLSIRSFKIFVDGALGARGAELSAPYSDAPDTRGLSQMSDAELDAFIRPARAKGFQVNAHVIGDRAVERALDAFERTGVTAAERFRLEHASIISPPNLSRFAELGVVASMQPVFIGEYSRWGEARVGPERAPWVMPIRELMQTGAVLASGTDYPASDSGDPRSTLSALVTRQGFDGRPEDGWFAGQAVDVETALRSMSAGPAYAAFQDQDLGALTVGRFADFTVLAEDPRSVPPDALRSMEVLMTVVGGEVVEIEGQ